jgi:excisionase family DNA binding protein
MISPITRRTRVDDLPELCRVREVAAFADCSEGAVRDAIRRGQLGHVVRIGRLLRVPRESIVKWLLPAEEQIAPRIGAA